MKINDILYSLRALYPENYTIKVKISGRTLTFIAKTSNCIQNPLTLILAKKTKDYETCDEKNLEAIFTRLLSNSENNEHMHRTLCDAFDRLKYGKNIHESKKQVEHKNEFFYRLKIRNKISGHFRTVARAASFDEIQKKKRFFEQNGELKENILVIKHQVHVINKNRGYHE